MTVLYTVEEVADQLSLNAETIRRLIRSGRINAIKTGTAKGRYRISQEALNLFLDGHVRSTKD